MTATNEYLSLKPWEHPQDYGGQTWYGWYAVYTQTRDSDALVRSNYRRILQELGKLDSELAIDAIDARNTEYDSPEDSTVTDTRQGHWGCGWLEVIYVHSSNVAACERADSFLNALEDYPVVDESDLSELEYDEYQNAWAHGLPHDFTQLLQKHLRLADSTVWKLEDSPRLQELYEELTPSGDYWEDNHMGTRLEYAAKGCTRERMASFLREMRKGQ